MGAPRSLAVVTFNLSFFAFPWRSWNIDWMNILLSTILAERMNGLAFIHINYGVDIDEEEVINIFAQKEKRSLDSLNTCCHFL